MTNPHSDANNGALINVQTSILPQKEIELVVSEHRSCADLESIRNQWSKLVQEVPGTSIFVTPEWLLSWWHAYCGSREFCLLAFTDPQAGVVAIAPLYKEVAKSFVFSTIRVLRLMGDGSGDSDDLDFVVMPGYAPAVAKAFFKWLRCKRWDTCELNCVSSQSEIAAMLQEEMRSMGWGCAVTFRPQIRVSLPDTWEQYLKQLSSKERKKVGYLLRRLEAHYEVAFRRCERAEELPAFLETLFSLHQKRWEARSEPGSFSLPERRDFYGEMSRLLLSRHWLELWQMELNGVPVAAQIGLRYGSCIYALQEGFDPAYADDSVGYVLRSHVLRSSIASGIRCYDFLYGDQQSKQRWGADKSHYLDIHFARPGTLGAFQLAAQQTCRATKDWFRARVPAEIWQILQAIRRFFPGQSALPAKLEDPSTD
ncbi:MAG: hypothetical protein CXZ00_13600 [Acidobacteria bacterium]|nr:MAG: hypothetical protein CXZ00_13600 [Acidobacteriota bacterium]